jgi:5-methylcytosine-specific restriction endonuclease McrA
MAHATNFKWQQLTRVESKEKRDRERQAEIDACYAAVDQRDGHICRVTGVFLTAGASDPHKRKERHHMVRRSRGGENETANVITVSAAIHQLDHAGKIHLSGDADLRDAQGQLCGVKLERMTESGWETVRMI